VPQPILQGLGEDVVPLELRIAPDLGVLAEELTDADFEGAMQVRDPSFPPFDELLIVYVRVADERVGVELHLWQPSGEMGCRDPAVF
jgi:hypothetical protein